MAAFPREGFLDLSRRLRIAWLRAVRLRLRRSLFEAEAQLGWLGWERVDFFDAETTAEVEKVREYENAEASLMNTSAELAGRKASLDRQLAAEKSLHDQAQKSLAEEREPIAAQLEQAEARRRQKLEAADRFERAIEEIARLEKQLEARSLSFMNIEHPSMAIRTEAREVSDELARLPGERKLVYADKAAALEQAARLEPEIARLRGHLQRIETASSAARDHLAAATRRLGGEMRLLEQEQRKSKVHMSRLDREKRKPYRRIGACLADHGIAPLNQPEVLEKVLTLRAREAELIQTLASLQAACAAADAGLLIAFYLLFAAILLAVAIIACHFRH